MILDQDDPRVEGAKHLWRFWGRTNIEVWVFLAILVALAVLSPFADHLLHGSPSQPAPVVVKVPACHSNACNSNGTPPVVRP